MKFVVILAVATVISAQFAYGKDDQTDSSNDQNNRPAMPPIEMRGPSPPGQSQGQGQSQDQRQGFIRKVRQASTPRPNTTMIPTTTTTTTDSSEECEHGGHRGHKRGHKH